jgi:hypothetical protein
MMGKYRFSAVDTAGQIKRGVLKAASLEEARDLLFDNQVQPKQLVEAGDDEAITWAARPVRREDDPASHFYRKEAKAAPPVRALFPATALGGSLAGKRGRGGLTADGSFAFQADGEAPLTVAREDLEVATLSGFLPRILRIIRIDGRMHEFSVGILVAPAGARETRKTLNKKN